MSYEREIRKLLNIDSCDWENFFNDENTFVYSFGDYFDYEGDEYYYKVIYHLDTDRIFIWKIFNYDRIDVDLGNFSYNEIKRNMEDLAGLYL